MYQYTSNRRLPGYNGALDLDIFYGDQNIWDTHAKGHSTTSIQLSSVQRTSSDHDRAVASSAPVHQGNAYGKLDYFNVIFEKEARIPSQGISRPGVKRDYNYHGGNALGFDVTFNFEWMKKQHKVIDVILRRCDQANGEGAVNDVRISDNYLSL